jgi:tetratricopeptide (TPR) repeat protein
MKIKYKQITILFLAIFLGSTAILSTAVLSEEAIDPQNPVVTELLAKLAKAPSSALYAELGWVYRSGGHLEKAKEAFAQASVLDPENAKAYDGWGWCYLDEKDFQNAEVVLGKAIELNPGNYGTLVGMWHCYRHKGAFIQGEDFLRKALELAPTSDWVYFELGLCYRDQKRSGEAEAMFWKALEINPQHYQACSDLGDYYRSQDMFEKAIEMYARASVIEPEKGISAILGLAECYNALGVHEKAIKNYKKAQAIDPGNYRTFIGMWDCYRHKGSFAEGHVFLQRALELAPTSDEVYFDLGISYRDQKQFGEAETMFLKALEINPQHYQACADLGDYYASKDMFEKAIEMYGRAYVIDPTKKGSVILGLMDCYNVAGDYAKALEMHAKSEGLTPQQAEGFDFEKPLKILLHDRPNSNELLNALGWLYRHQGRYKKAQVVFEKVLARQRTNARACEGLAGCLQALNRSDEARHWFEKAIEYNPQADGAYLGLGRYYFEQMNYAKSLDFLETSLKINGNNAQSKKMLLYCRHNLALLNEPENPAV